MEKKKSKGKLIALIIAIVVVVGVVTTGIVLAATGTLFGSTKEKAFDLLKQAPEKMTQSAVSKQLGLDELSKAMLEKALVDKMSYIVNKNASPHSDGGLFRAYQLTNKKYNENEKQNGFIFYVRAWNTSKIDPTTGFVNMLPLKYQSKEKSKEFGSSGKQVGFG